MGPSQTTTPKKRNSFDLDSSPAGSSAAGAPPSAKKQKTTDSPQNEAASSPGLHRNKTVKNLVSLICTKHYVLDLLLIYYMLNNETTFAVLLLAPIASCRRSGRATRSVLGMLKSSIASIASEIVCR